MNKLDPDFPPAFSGLSDAYLWAGLQRGSDPQRGSGTQGKGHGQEGIRLDEASAEAHASLAT